MAGPIAADSIRLFMGEPDFDEHQRERFLTARGS